MNQISPYYAEAIQGFKSEEPISEERLEYLEIMPTLPEEPFEVGICPRPTLTEGISDMILGFLERLSHLRGLWDANPTS